MTISTRPKLLLFDIDGTLLSARGVPKMVMHKVLTKRYPGMSYDHDFDFSGRTDPEIIEYLLQYNDQDGDQQLIISILAEFVTELEAAFARNHKPYLLDGVEALIKNLAEMTGVFLGLVTGNIAEGARIKLEPVGLRPFFPVGGFGDDSKYRNKLPPIAINRAEAYYATDFMKEDIWIIGDSIYDISCANDNALRCLAVASGRTGYTELAAAQPEFLEKDLSDVKNILNVLLNK